VIALSPFRAELGRGRRLRRADALYDGADLGTAVRALPGDELYYVLHEIGLQEGAEILAEATAEQVQVVLDFGIWDRDQIDDEGLDEWLAAMATAPVERVGQWLAGIDSEILGLLLRRRARIYDLSQEGAPEEPEGTFFPTPDRLFVLDVLGDQSDGNQRAAVVIRLVDAFYRTDQDLARRVLIGARAELDAELEENAYRWRQARMADLGFADYYEALEVYRELDPATVNLGNPQRVPEPSRDGLQSAEPTGAHAITHGGLADAALRVPTALAERLRDTAGSPFARAAQKVGDARAAEELRSALVALTNQVLAADRIGPGDDEAVAATLARMAATLDIAVERLAGGDDDRGAQALRTVPLIRLFRLGFSLTARVRRLAVALRRGGPLGRRGFALAEAADAAVLEAVTRARPMYPSLLDHPPATGERPFGSLADVARAAAGVEVAAAAQALLYGLGIRDRDLAPGSPALAETGTDEAALDLGIFARTALVRRLSDASTGNAETAFGALDPREVAAFEARLRPTRGGPPELPAPLKSRAHAALQALKPRGLAAGAAEAVIERWLAGLAPLEPVLVRAPADKTVTPKSKPQTRRKAKLETKPKTKLRARPKTKLKAKPKAKPKTKPKAKPKAKPKTKLRTKPKPRRAKPRR
jgi:hypothetical protein